MLHKYGSKIVEIPATIAFQPTPCTWTVGNDDVFRAHISSLQRAKEHGVAGRTSVTFPDAWSVRADFLDLRDENDCLGFLNETGLFFRDGANEAGQPMSLDHIRIWQRTFIGFLRRRPAVWETRLELVEPNASEIIRMVHLHRHCTVALGEGRAAQFIARETFSAILATIYLDHLRGTRFRLCARPDCGRPYEIESRHTRKYCTQYCASLQSLRRVRQAESKHGKSGPNNKTTA
jgi:hypothetical protein